MPKRATTLTLALPPRAADVPTHRWLGDALRVEILEGRLGPGTRLPATRDLARQCGVSRGTIVSAFDRLKAEGYLEGSVGSGTFVRRVLPDDLLTVRGTARRRPVRDRVLPRRVSSLARRAQPFPALEMRPARAFRANLPALDLFPTSVWAQIASRRARGARMSNLLGAGPFGFAPLQSSVAQYLRVARGVTCVPEQVAIVSGVQEALDLATRLVVDPGDAVCMEDPGYIGAARVFEAWGADVVWLPVDSEGMVLPAAQGPEARLAYVTPAHQMPLGVSMSLPRRLQLLAWARASGAWIFEDDYDSEYRYVGRPLPALQGLDRDHLVVFAGSFSKTLFPALRLGYVVVPPELIEPLAAIKSIATRHAPLLEQTILHEFIEEGHFARHVRRMREVYAERRSVLIEGVETHLRGLLEISSLEAGLQTVGWLAEGLSADTVTRAASDRGVDVAAVHPRVSRHMPREALLLGFASPDPVEIRRGVKELAAAILESRARRPRVIAGRGRRSNTGIPGKASTR